MRKRVVSLFMALVLCVSLMPTAAWATTENDADSNAESAGQRVTEAKTNADAPPAGPDGSAPAPAGEDGGLPSSGGDGENVESSDLNPSNDVPSVGAVQAPPANNAAPATQEADIPTPLANEDTSAEAVAKIGETSFTSLQDALNAAKDGDTITLQQDIVTEASEAFVFDGSKTVTLDMNSHSITGQYDTYNGAFLNIKSGTLTIRDTVGEFITIGQKTRMKSTTILVSGGTLEFQNKVKITGGLKVTNDGQLTGSLKEGSIFLYNDYNSVHTISVKGSNIYKLGGKNQIVALLEKGYAFAKCDGNGTPANPLALRSGESASDSNVIVISHPTCSFTTSACDCGRPCPHANTKSDGSCAACGTEPEAKIGDSYHWTLQAALDAAQDGDTVTLLKKQSGVSCTYNNSGAITIDLNRYTWSNAYGTPLTISSGHVTLKNGKVLGGNSERNQRGVDVAANAGLTLGENMVVKGTGGDITSASNRNFYQAIGLKSKTSQLTLSKGSVVLGGLDLSNARTPASYLPAGTALVRCSYDENTGTVTYTKDEDGSYQFITEAYPSAWYFNGDMAVVAHLHSFANGTCACGLTAAAGIGDNIYSTVTDAVAAAGGKTVKLLVGSAGLGESLTVDSGETLTIDLNGNTLSAAVTVLGTLTLTNSADGDGIAASVTLGDGTTDGTLQIPDGKVRIDSLTVANKTAAPLPQQGRYHAISCTGGLTLGDLLPQPDVDGTRYTFRSVQGVYKHSATGFSIATTGIYATIQPCTAHGEWGNGLCGYCGYACPHSSTDNDGKCETCGGQFAARLNTDTGAAAKSYATLLDAIAAANATPGSTLQLLQSSDATQTFTSTGTWTLDMHGKTLPNTSFTVESGTLAVQNLHTGTVGKLKSVTVKDSGTLEVPVHTGGCIEGIDTVTVEEGGSAALGYGNTVYGSITNNNPNGTLRHLLGDGCAFADADGSLINGYTAHSAANVKVAAHSDHTIGADFTCPCGFSCNHPNGFPDGKCPDCGTLCPHTDLAGSGDTYTCNTCGQTMAVRVTKGNAVTYYAETFDRANTENTLQTVFNAVESDSTVTLLADRLYAFAFVKDNKTLTLNLNGKSLVETYDNGIAVDSGSTLTVTGQGSSTALVTSDGARSYVFNVRGGTLVLDSDLSSSFGRIRVGSGTLTFNSSATVEYLDIDYNTVHITLNSGTFGCIAGRDTFTGSVAANSLLPEGYAFRKADGSYVAYGTELTKGTPLEGVTVVKCPHPSVNSHGSYTDRWCDSCDKQIAASVETAAGAFTYYEDFDAALDAARKSPGCTLTLYEDDCKLDIPDGSFTLDVNGRSPAEVGYENGLYYALRVQEGAAVTVKNLHVAGDRHDWDNKGYAGSVYVESGASLTLEGCEVQDLRTVLTGFEIDSSTVELDDSYIYGTLKAYYCNLTVVDGFIKNISATDGSTVELRGGQVGTLDAERAERLTLSGGDFASITAPDEKTLKDCLAEGYVLWKGSSVIDSDVNSLPAEDDAWYGVGLPPFKNVQAVNPTVTTTYGQSVTLNAGIDCGGSTRGFTLTWYCDGVQQGDPAAITPSSNAYSHSVTPASAGAHTYRLVFAKSGYSEACTFTVTVEPAALTGVSVRQTGELTYTGQPLTATVATSAAAVNDQPVTFTYCAAQDGTYSAAVPAFTAAGEHTVYYKASAPNHAEYTGSFTVTIGAKAVTAPVIEVAGGSVYNGKAQIPTVTVRDGSTTIDPSEYTVVYTNNINAGTATVTIKDKEGGNYAVSGSATFSIAQKDITGATITLGESLIYNATPQKQTVASVVTADGIPVTTYDVVSDVGTTPGGSPFDLTVYGTGNFTGSASTTFTVAPAPLTIKALDKTIYVGGEAPDLTTPVLGEHYTVEGLMGNDTLEGLMEGVTLQYVDADGNPVTPDTSKTGKVRIQLRGGEQLPGSGNYDITYVEGTLTIATRSSYYYTKPTSPDAEQSPRTGDAGLLVYGLTALGSYTGTALVLRRRKRED